MDDNRQEKIADIIAEMRNGFEDKLCPWRANGGDCYHCPFGGKGINCSLDKFADRIEAAWKREKAEIEANAPVGNAAKLREALEDSQSLLESFLYSEIGSQVQEQMRDNRAALSAPARKAGC